MIDILSENLKKLIWKHFYNLVVDEMKQEYFNKRCKWDIGIYKNSGGMIFRNLKNWRGINKNYSGYHENVKYIKYYWNYLDINFFLLNKYNIYE